MLGGDDNLQSYNLFVYCCNSPVGLKDNAGKSAEAIVTGWTTSMWWLTLVDGPLPIGDLIFFIGFTVLSFSVYDDYTFENSVYQHKAGDGITEHTNGHKSWEKHSKPRPGRKTTKNRKKKQLEPKSQSQTQESLFSY